MSGACRFFYSGSRFTSLTCYVYVFVEFIMGVVFSLLFYDIFDRSAVYFCVFFVAFLCLFGLVFCTALSCVADVRLFL